MTDRAVPTWGGFEWNAERIATVKRVADGGGTAVDAAAAINLAPDRTYLIYKLAEREGFKFRSQGRRTPGAITIILDPQADTLLNDRCGHQHMDRRDLAARLLTIVLQQGPTFIDNLLDDGA